MMKKQLKRMISMLLTAALLCVCCVNAFAATTASASDSYGGYGVSGLVTIQRRTVTGRVTVDSDAPIGYNRSVSVAYTYYFYNHYDLNDYKDDTLYAVTTDRNVISANKTYNGGSIYSMRNAVATFRATIKTANGVSYFAPSNRTVEYPYPEN